MTSKLAYDMPDDWPWLPGSSRFPLSDMGELAVRLGSPDVYDRRGELIWFDTCDKGIAPFTCSGAGTGFSTSLSVQFPLYGSYSLKMISGSTGTPYVLIQKRLNVMKIPRVGFEIAIRLPSDFNTCNFEIYRYTGTKRLSAILRLDHSVDKLQYLDSDLVYNNIATVPLTSNPLGMYHIIKLVCDTDTGIYLRALYDNDEYDLSAYNLRSIATVDVPYYLFVIQLNGRVTFNDTAYIGHILVTGNEP
jgi:hypothetical protein